ncbi:MAG: D-alanyl-D-alanine carboxypeptidase [Blautia sp.]|nr:D-alanyl-D-alanine carboxypeptidase [Blautia sp.]
MRKKLFTHLLLACLCLSLSAGSSVRVMAEEYEEEYDSSGEESYDDGSYEEYDESYSDSDTYQEDTYDSEYDGEQEDASADAQAVSDAAEDSAADSSAAGATEPTSAPTATAADPETHQAVQADNWENYTTYYSDWPAGPDISAASAIVMEDSTGTILYAKNMDTPVDPGSAVKILTVMLALEKAKLTDEVTMTETGVQGVTEGGLNISSQVGEIFTIEQCAYAVILASANDVALQLAEHISGSVDAFVQLMNSRAAELGCTGSHFTNPTGLEDPAQYSTAHDLAMIMQTALRNEDFRKIISATTYTIPATNMSGGDRTLSTSFSMVNTAGSDYYSGTLGGKQGYTGTAGATILCAAQRKGMTLICAILQGTSDSVSYEAASLLDFGFGTFNILSLGNDDFDIVTGGEVVAPQGITAADMTYVDEEKDSQIIRTYFYDSLPIGTAVVNPQQNSIDEAALAADRQNLEEAKAYSQSKSILPYILIGLAGIGLMVLWFFQSKKIIKK